MGEGGRGSIRSMVKWSVALDAFSSRLVQDEEQKSKVEEKYHRVSQGLTGSHSLTE